MSQQFKLKLVDGNYAFAFKKPSGFQVPVGVVSKGSVYSERFELYFTENHQEVIEFTKTTRGTLLHYKRRSDSALLPEKVLPENADGIVSELGIDSIADLYDAVFGEPVIETLNLALSDLEDLPDVRNAERPTSKVPDEAKWQTYADYQPFGALYDGLLPGYLSGYSKALAKALDDRLTRRGLFQVWTHKADDGYITGYRKLHLDAFGKPYGNSAVEISANFTFNVGRVLKAESLEAAIREFHKQLDDISAELTKPMRIGVVGQAAA